jgi:hypothetical protein
MNEDSVTKLEPRLTTLARASLSVPIVFFGYAYSRKSNTLPGEEKRPFEDLQNYDICEKVESEFNPLSSGS